MTNTKAHHRQYLLQGIMNFFMEQGKVALVAFEDSATQEWFENRLVNQAPTYLGCEVIQLHASENADALQTFNALLARISLQQATKASDTAQANYLLWVSENEQFTPEFFQLLKNIILQFSGLQLKLFVSVTSDRWSERLFDIAGRKISYWFVPAMAATHSEVSPSLPSHDRKISAQESLAASHAPDSRLSASPQNLMPSQSAPTRRLNRWIVATGLLLLLGVAAYWIEEYSDYQFQLSAFGASKKVEPAPAAEKVDAASESEKKAESPVAPIASEPEEAAASEAKAKSVDSEIVNIAKDCPPGLEEFPTAKPTSHIKDTNYIYLKSAQNREICVASAGGAFKLVSISALKGIRVYGDAPWRVYSPDLREIEIYFEGSRVPLAPHIAKGVQVIAR